MSNTEAIERAEAGVRAAQAEYFAAVQLRDVAVASSGLTPRALADELGGAYSNWAKKRDRGQAVLDGTDPPRTKRGANAARAKPSAAEPAN